MSFAIKIGNYRFSKNLGNGNFGKVKLAFNEVTNHKVAIKILNKRKIKHQGVFEKVKREIKVLRKYNHPHIIKHFEFIDTQSDIFIVLEYAAGGELFDLISREERLDEHEARRIFQQIISSIEYAHLTKMSHRDLKPENLLLDEENNIKLIDFGLANQMKDGVSLTTACGSPNYAAPEVISGQAYGGEEVDIWSCGVILYAMVCGSLPFDDDMLPILFQKIKEGRYFLPNFVSREVRDLINKMLQPNPVKRIKLKEIKEHRWYNQNLPAYLKELSNHPARYENQVDYEVVKQLFEVDKRITKSFEEVCKDITDKKPIDYVGAYELMKHDKLKKECFNQGASSSGHLIVPAVQVFKDRVFYSEKNVVTWIQQGSKHVSQVHLNRLNHVHNKIKSRTPAKALNNNFMGKEQGQDTSQASSTTPSQSSSCGVKTAQPKAFHGLGFEGDPNHALHLICLTLKRLDYEWQFGRDKKLKCRIKLDKEPLLDDEDFIQDFISRKFLRFNISIFKEPILQSRQSNGTCINDKSQPKVFMISIQLVKGTPLVFLDFAQNFFSLLKAQLNQQREKLANNSSTSKEQQMFNMIIID